METAKVAVRLFVSTNIVIFNYIQKTGMLILVNPFPVAVYASIMNLKEEASEVFRDMFGNFAPGN